MDSQSARKNFSVPVLLGLSLWLFSTYFGGCSTKPYQVKPEPADMALRAGLAKVGERLPLQATVVFPPGTEDFSITKPPYALPVGEAFTAVMRDATYAVFMRPGTGTGGESQNVNVSFELVKARIEYDEALFRQDRIVSEFQVKASVKDKVGNILWTKNLQSRATSPLKEVDLPRTERPMAMYAAFDEVAERFIKEVSSSDAVLALLPPELDFVATLHDANGDGTLEGEEEVRLSIEIVNSGKKAAQDVEVLLSGTQALVSVLGTRRGIGTILPSETARAAFDTILPPEMATERAVLQVEVKGQEIPLTLVEAFETKVVSKHKPLTVGDIKVDFKLSPSDANRNGIWEGGEEVTLAVEISNVGQAAVEEVEILLTGQPAEITRTMGSGSAVPVGTVMPGENRHVEFTATLPHEVPVGQATFQVRIKNRLSSHTEKLVVETVPKLDVPARKDDYAVIIGIEEYRDIAGVDYAARDARTMQSYLVNLLGYPEENTLLLVDERATKSDLEKSFQSWLKNRVSRDSRVFIFYAGHGAPYYSGQEGSNPLAPDAYLVPYDGDPNDLARTGYALAGLYEVLDSLSAKEVVLALDSCFSGTGGRSVRAAGTRPIRIEPETAYFSPSVVTFSAAKNNQVSTSYPDGGHGLFTYYFLEGLQGGADQDSNGWVEVEELFEYVKPRVERQARLVNLQQTPTLAPFPLGSKESLRLFPAALVR